MIHGRNSRCCCTWAPRTECDATRSCGYAGENRLGSHDAEAIPSTAAPVRSWRFRGPAVSGHPQGPLNIGSTNSARNAASAALTHPAGSAGCVPAVRCHVEPRPTGAKKLVGNRDWRIRIGQCRIVYEIDDDAQVVTIFVVAKRSDAYR
ncbi:type II toxin-antitoxin system RelE/ParE family toxin [Nocardia sp. NPDC051990]|uniref:type II toxin-antitoxin system RelE family toxin n=1 Tax=Nocardia sp. NPDC051990 TaxID=3155285 RepID=UPI00343A1E13